MSDTGLAGLEKTFYEWARELPETKWAVTSTRKDFGDAGDITTNEQARIDLGNALQIRVFEAYLRDHGVSVEDDLGALIVDCLNEAVDLDKVARKLLEEEGR